MGFWIAAIALAALAAVYIARPLALTRRSARSRAAHDEQVFRDQLVEIDNDRERGVLSEEEARAARIEVSRRLLAAAAERERAADHAPAPKLASYALAATLLVGAPLGGWALYGQLGAPDLPDQPFAARQQGARPPQAVAEARMGGPAPQTPDGAEQILQAIESGEARLEQDGPDRETLFGLGQAYSAVGRFGDAWRAYGELIDLGGGDAPAQLYTMKAEAMVLAARGYVSPEAEDALQAALTRAPDDPIARYYMGAAYAQTRRPESALETWVNLLEDSPANAPWRQPAIAQIEDLVERTGLPAPDIPTPPEPTEAERRAAMDDIVSRLDARLLAEGGDPLDWAQLVRTYRTLGRDAEATAAEARARADLAGDAVALEEFDALLAEVAPDPHEGVDMSAARDRGADIDPRAAAEALEARLSEGGAGPALWLRLITAYAAAGDADAARDAYDRGRAALADQPARLAALERSVAERLGGEAASNAGPPPGPTAEDMAAASEMAPEDRMAMIRGMVEGLQVRLYDEGGSAEEWARLVRTLGVLGETEQAREAREKGLAAHGANLAAVARIDAAARAAGIVEE